MRPSRRRALAAADDRYAPADVRRGRRALPNRSDAGAGMSDDLSSRKDAVLLAMLPTGRFDGGPRPGIRVAAERAGIDIAELPLLFPAGTRDVAAWFSDWADRQTLTALKRRHIGTMKIRARIATGVLTRLEILLPHREAVRRSLSL